MAVTVTHLDVADELGRVIDSDEEIKQINRWISAAKAVIRKRLGDLDSLDADALTVVIPQAVARLARNPEGKINERIDDYSYGFTSKAAALTVTLTDEEWALLTPDRVGSDRGAFTIRPSYVPGRRGWSW